MLTVDNNISNIEGSAKEICIEFTHLIVHLIKTLEKEFELSQEQAVGIINECCKIAYMNDEDRAEYLSNILKEE